MIKKKLLVFLLTFSMILGLAPNQLLTVYADNNTPTQVVSEVSDDQTVTESMIGSEEGSYTDNSVTGQSVEESAEEEEVPSEEVSAENEKVPETESLVQDIENNSNDAVIEEENLIVTQQEVSDLPAAEGEESDTMISPEPAAASASPELPVVEAAEVTADESENEPAEEPAEEPVAREAAEEATYKLTDSLTDGKEYLIVSAESGSGYALANNELSIDAAAVNIENADIDGDGEADSFVTTDSAAVRWTAAANGNGFNLSNESAFLEGTEGAIKIVSELNNASRYWTYINSSLQHVGGSYTYVLRYNDGFTHASYQADGGTDPGYKVYLFEKTEVIPGTAAVTGVTLDQETLTLEEGETAALRATVAPADAANRNVIWSSSNEAAAAVNGGVVSAVAPGTATITVTTEEGSFAASCTVTVTAKPTVEEADYKLVGNLTDGKEYLIVSTDSGSGYALANDDLNMEAAAVAVQSGDVDGDGTADTYITTTDPEIIWTVAVNGDGYNLSNDSAYLEGTGGTIKIVSELKNASRHWTYTNNSLQHVGGSYTYVLRYNEGFTAASYNAESGTDPGYKVYIYEKAEAVPAGTTAVTGVTLDKSEITLEAGKTAELKAAVAPADAANKNVTWSSSNETVATVNSGIITAAAEGTATITVKTEDGNFTAECSVTVTAKPAADETAYKLVDEFTDGEEYLIVSVSTGDGYALANPGGTSDGASLGSTQVSIESGDIDSDGIEDSYIYNEEAAAIWTATANSGGFVLTNGSDFLEGKSGNVSIYNSHQYEDRGWSYTDNQLYQTGGQNTYTIYYSDGFTSTYDSTEETVYLFEETEVAHGTAAVTGVTLDQSELSLIAGKTGTLKATVSPSDAANKKVTWSTSDETIATVTEKGVVKGIAEGEATITATTVDGEFKAVCVVTVLPKPVGTGVNIGITSDVHGNVDGLKKWLQSVQEEIEPDLEVMIYCGDYSYKMQDLEAFVDEFNQIVAATNKIVGDGKGIYTSGNHEYYINGQEIPLDERFLNTPGFVRIGEALVKPNYIVYCLGASGWGGNAVGSYPDEDIAALDAYLKTAPSNIPIFIPAHFPLHYISGRTVEGADKVIAVLNKYPNTIFLWGHNHSHSDTHYGQILKEGESIEYASGESAEISFTYACAGGMYQESQTKYSGLVANVSDSGDTVTFQFYQTSTGQPIGDPTTLYIEQPEPAVTYTITASAGENGSISPSGEVEAEEGKDQEFQFIPDEGYEPDKVLVDGEEAEFTGTSYTFESVAAAHTIEVSFKEVTWGEPTYTWSEDNTEVKASRTASDGTEETETVAAALEVTTPATCETPGTGIRTSAEFENTAFTVQTREVEIPSTGHEWEFVSFTWTGNDAAGYTKAVGSYKCTHDESHTNTAAAVLTIAEGTGDDVGSIIYTATIAEADSPDGKLHTDIKKVGSTCTVTFDTKGGSAVEAQEVTYGEKAVKPAEDPVFDGWAFKGWSGNAAAFAEFDFSKPVLEDTTVYAVWQKTVSVQRIVDEYGKIKVYDAVIDAADPVSGSVYEDVIILSTDSVQTIDVEYVPAAGYKFSSWSIRPAAGTAVSTESNPNTYTAAQLTDGAKISVQTEPIQFAVKFDANGGSGVMTNQSFVYGGTDPESRLLKPNEFSRVGYTFTGWNTAADGTGTVYEDEADVCKITTVDKEVITLYAQWSTISYTISYDLAGGELAEDAVNPTSYTIESDEITLNNPAKEGYTFEGWTGTGLDEAAASVKIAKGSSGNRRYKAVWTINQYTITFDTAGGSQIAAITADYGTSVTAPKDPVKEGYTFEGWTLGIPKTMPAEDTKVTASWTPEEYSITYHLRGGSNDDANPAVYTIESDTITLANAHMLGYTFGGWYSDEKYTTQVSHIAKGSTGDVVLYAKWTMDPYKIQYELNGGIVEVPNPTAYSIETETFTLNNPTKEGYDFAGWTGTGLTSAMETVTVTKGSYGNREYTALWTPKKDTPYVLENYFETLDGDYFVIKAFLKGTTDETAEASPLTMNGFSFDEENEDNIVSGTVAADGSLVLVLYYTRDSYKVTFIDEDGTELQTSQVKYEAIPECESPKKAATAQYTYTFAGWDPEIDKVKGDVVYKATYADKPQVYTIDPETWKWTGSDEAGYTAAEVIFRAGEGDFTRTLMAAITSEVTEPTCLEAGETVYTATVTYEGKSYTDVRKAAIEPTGHNWDAGTWTWTEDHTAAYITFVCRNDSTHTEKVDAVVTSVTDDPKCTEDGKTVYTAKAVFEENTYTDVQTEVLPSIGHDWSEVIVIVAPGCTVHGTGYMTCKNDPDHIRIVTIDAEGHDLVKIPAVEPTCEEPGSKEYWKCSKCNELFSDEAGTVKTTLEDTVIAPLGHKWGEPSYEWAEDYSSVTAKAVCERDETHTETEVSKPEYEVTKAPTYTETGIGVYTAVFENELFSTQTAEVEIPMLDKIVPTLELQNTPNGISAAWDKIRNAGKYMLERKAADGSWQILSDSLEVNEYPDGNVYQKGDVLMGSSYSYRVKAYVDDSWGEYSNEETILFNPFTDVTEGNKLFEYISWAYNEMIVSGKGDGSEFGPDDGCTRMNFVMMLWKMNGRPEVTGVKNPFTDVSGNQSLKAVLWAYSEGIIVGTSKTTFSPGTQVKREQIVMMLWKMAGQPEVQVKNPFTDVTGAKSTKAVLWAYSNKITTGTSKTTFAPKDTCTRGQLVTFLYKYNKLINQ